MTGNFFLDIVVGLAIAGVGAGVSYAAWRAIYRWG